jgi:hypothetical protein
VTAPLPCVIEMMTMLNTEETNQDWPRAVHEGAHVLVALLLGDHVDGATLRNDHPSFKGMTWTTAVPWHAVQIDRAGYLAEPLVLSPETFAARAARAITPWAADFENAKAHALLFAGSCDNMKDARRLAPPAGQEAALEAAVEAQPKSFAPEVIAAYEQREAAQMPRRLARAQRLIAHADEVVHRMLSKNLIVLRVIADRLSKTHTLGADELLSLFEEGVRRQLEDDRLMARAAGSFTSQEPQIPEAISTDDTMPGPHPSQEEP